MNLFVSQMLSGLTLIPITSSLGVACKAVGKSETG